MNTYESKQLLKPVISISENIELGTVSDIIIDGTNKKVIALSITKGKFFYIPFEKISAITENSILVMSSQDIIPYNKFKINLEKLIQDKISIINTICLNNGEECGTVKEYIIDKEGNIISCKIVYEKIIDVKDINIFAKDYTIMNNIDNTKTKTVMVSQKADIPTEKEVIQKQNNEPLYQLYLNKKLKKDLNTDNKTYTAGTIITKQIVDELIDMNKTNLLGNSINI